MSVISEAALLFLDVSVFLSVPYYGSVVCVEIKPFATAKIMLLLRNILALLGLLCFCMTFRVFVYLFVL